jgi:hypothetical protein
VRFMALAIFLTGDLLRECAFSSRTSAFDQERRLARLRCLLAITYPLATQMGVQITVERGRVESNLRRQVTSVGERSMMDLMRSIDRHAAERGDELATSSSPVTMSVRQR